jgi:hypothetical protein
MPRTKERIQKEEKNTKKFQGPSVIGTPLEFII